MSEITKQIGLHLQHRRVYDTEYVIAKVVAREDDREYPQNVTTNDSLDGLELKGHVSEYGDFALIGFEPEFYDVYSLDIRRLEAKLKTLRKIQKRLEKDHATEPGDVLVAVAQAIGATFCVQQVGTERGSRYADNDWRFFSIGEGRNVLRSLIEQAQHDARIAKNGTAA